MPPRIPRNVVHRVVRQFIRGESYESIAAKAGVAKGSVANIVEGLRSGTLPDYSSLEDEVDGLRAVALAIRKAGLDLTAAETGLEGYKRLLEVGVTEPREIPFLLKTLRRLLDPEADVGEYLRAAMRLQELEGETGMQFSVLVQETEVTTQEFARVKEEVQKLQKERDEESRGLREVKGAVASGSRELARIEKAQQTLRNLGLKTRDFNRAADFVASCKAELGLNPQTVAHLALLHHRMGERGVALEALLDVLQRLDDLEQRGFTIDKAEAVVKALEDTQGGFPATLLWIAEAIDKGLTLEERLGLLKTEVQAKKDDLKDVQRSLKERKAETRATEDRLRQLKEELQENRDHFKALQQRLGDAERELREEREALATLLDTEPTALAIQREIEGLETKKTSLAESVGRMVEEVADLERRKEAIQKDVDIGQVVTNFLRSGKLPRYPALFTDEIKKWLGIVEGRMDYLEPFRENIERRVRDHLIVFFREVVREDIVPKWGYESLEREKKRLQAENEKLKMAIRKP